MTTNFYDLNDNATNIVLFAENTESIQRGIEEWLQNCIAKKIRRGEVVTVEHLCECSTLKKIVSEAIKLYRKCSYEDYLHITAVDRLQARQYLANSIMEEAKCIAKQTVNA